MTSYRDVFVYVMIDNYLKSCKHICLSQSEKMSDAEVVFIYLIACLDYGGNLEKSMQAMYSYGNITHLLSKSHYNRRLHALADRIEEIFALLSQMSKAANQSYALDSFPLPICHNIRIQRARLVKQSCYRGRNASKRVYFYGYKVHLITAADGSIVEFEFAPAAYEDKIGFALLNFDLPTGSVLYADKAYNYYQREEELQQDGGIDLQVIRKRNSKKEDNLPIFNWLKQSKRKHIETTISVLMHLFPRKIHAVTPKGFLLKIIGFIIAHNCNLLFAHTT